MIMYGIANCDTVKKARRWLQEQHIAYEFHDYKKCGLSRAKLNSWMQAVSWEILLNRRGTTWRQLNEADKQNLTQSHAIKLMLANLSLIKRPVLEFPEGILVGYSESEYRKLI